MKAIEIFKIDVLIMSLWWEYITAWQNYKNNMLIKKLQVNVASKIWKKNEVSVLLNLKAWIFIQKYLNLFWNLFFRDV